jgi:N-acetyl sugar amidotransferase
MGKDKILDRQLPSLPSEIRFCRRCVVSNQRPRIVFDEEGICGACRYTEIKNHRIDWATREKELRDLCDQHRSKEGRFDVIIPASGGKDSSRVAYELKYRYGMHPLTVTWAPFEYTPEGYTNFRNFIKVGGFNNLMAWPNGKLHRKLSRLAFEALGDAWQPFTFGQMCYAFHIAQAFNIRLVFFGENGEAEYSGDPRVFNLRGMPFELWAEQYFKGIMVDDLIEYGLEETDYFSKDDYDESDLIFYRPPDMELMQQMEVTFHWFSYYKKWVPQENYYCASENTGFQANPTGRSEGTYSKYASLDDQMDGFHFYLAFIKFGIGRATSDAAHEVRDGHITREEAAVLVRRYDGEFPKRWYEAFKQYLNINDSQFWEVIDKFRQSHVWRNESGVWKLNKAVYDEYEIFRGSPPGYISSLAGEKRS